MFYGLNKFIKTLLPKQLFYRALLIVAAPIILLQITISIVFFDSLWIKTNKGMSRALVNEIKFFINAYENEQHNKDSLTKLFSENHDVKVIYVSEKILPKDAQERWFSPMDRTLRRELKSKKLNYWFDTTKFKDSIDLKIQYSNGYFQFLVPKERVTNTSARIFALWITLPAFLLITVALIFLKNQTRPIINLARASEKFGRGEDIGEYRPSGALEIRQAGYEFERMRKRIIRHLNQRSEMLSGISHDLRTPLTRLKLQLAMTDKKDNAKKMASDIDEMEKMLNDYLQYAKSQSEEDYVEINISDLVEDILENFDHSKFEFKKNGNIQIFGRKNLLRRSLSNIVENGLSYGDKIFVEIKKSVGNAIIIIEDNGPGLPKKEYENVFKPFYRVDKSRSLNRSGVGLGLSISLDIVKSHGGNIVLSESEHNGLAVKVSLPF